MGRTRPLAVPIFTEVQVEPTPQFGGCIVSVTVGAHCLAHLVPVQCSIVCM